jgi:predicted negative regulator of RcsB-dependent stress response
MNAKAEAALKTASTMVAEKWDASEEVYTEIYSATGKNDKAWQAVVPA